MPVLAAKPPPCPPRTRSEAVGARAPGTCTQAASPWPVTCNCNLGLKRNMGCRGEWHTPGARCHTFWQPGLQLQVTSPLKRACHYRRSRQGEPAQRCRHPPVWQSIPLFALPRCRVQNPCVARSMSARDHAADANHIPSQDGP